jgi:hypothetical protein
MTSSTKISIDLSYPTLHHVCSARGDHWQKIVEQRAIKKKSNIFIVGKFCKKSTCKIGDFKIVKHVYM